MIVIDEAEIVRLEDLENEPHDTIAAKAASEICSLHDKSTSCCL